MSHEYLPSLIYNNLKAFIEYRKIQTDHVFMSDTDLSKKMEHFEYVRIDGKRTVNGEERNQIILLISPTSQYVLKTENFKKLLAIIPTVNISKCDIMIIANTLEPNTNIKKQLLVVKTLGYNIEFLPYKLFILIVPHHKAVPFMTIADNDEVNDYCKNYYTSKTRLPKIQSTDPSVLWIGANIGDVLRIHRNSEICSTSIAYRLVVRG
jgi:DNA-directed RNA polymerase subunit H (RpoH/RPB5)